MKWLFILLVVLNVSFFAWQMNQEQTYGTDLTQLPAIVGENLVLLTEVDNLSSRTKRPPRPDGREMPAACYQLLPFKNIEEAERMAQSFRDVGIDAEARVGEEKEKTGYLVSLPSTGNLEDAQRTIEELKTKKIEDFAIVTVDGVDNTVVLGLFQTQPAVERRIDELKVAGYEAKATEHFRKTEVFLVEFEEKSHHSVPPELWLMLTTEYPDVTRMSFQCP